MTTALTKPLPKGFIGESANTDGLGRLLWRFLICGTCWALVPDEVLCVDGHRKWHEEGKSK